MTRRWRTPIAVLIACLVLGGLVGCGQTAGPATLRVDQAQLVGTDGEPLVLRGVNRPGTEYFCVQGHGIFDGPSDDASIEAMADWKINVVRVPLNQSCWLGLDGAPPEYSGEAYRAAITDYVARLHAAGLMAILDLHWTAPGDALATSQRPMADADHSPDFWTSVATTFKDDQRVVFDLFNEPLGISWECWRDGGDCGIGYEVAGMQTLVDTVRATGATQPLMLGGLSWSNDLTGWLEHKPNDPQNNLIAAWHSYNFNACNNVTCWEAQLAPVAAAVPLVAGEIGQDGCDHDYIDPLMGWLDAHGTGYLGWGWGTHDCSTFPALISDYDGTPTDFGAGLRDHLGGAPVPTPTLTPTPTPTPSPSVSHSPSASASVSPSPSDSASSASPSASASATPSSPSSPSPPVGGSDLSVTTSVNADAAPYWWEAAVDLTAAGTVTDLELVVTVKKTAGLKAGSFYTDTPGGTVALKQETTDSGLIYRANLADGASLPAATYRAGIQYAGEGTAHPTADDTYEVRATVGGKTVTVRGHF